jgi:hypothetical protein
MMEWLFTGVWLVIGSTEHLQNLTTDNFNSLTELRIPNITLTHIKSSQSSIAVAW